MALKDITGQRFGALIPLRPIRKKDKAGNQRVWWQCKCDCGSEHDVRANCLTRKVTPTTSCGCRATGPRTKDLTGRVFHKLTVVRRVEGEDRFLWQCKCDCGGTIAVRPNHLRNGTIKGCGCLKTSPRKDPVDVARRQAFNNYRTRAKRKSITFRLTEARFQEIACGACHYCGRAGTRNHNGFVFNGIDRVNAKRGYTPSNSVPCCPQCNFAKRTSSESEFLAMVRRIYDHRLL